MLLNHSRRKGRKEKKDTSKNKTILKADQQIGDISSPLQKRKMLDFNPP